jgi:thiosulfate/3-mercaptopyruvate sulfurtransferase
MGSSCSPDDVGDARVLDVRVGEGGVAVPGAVRVTEADFAGPVVDAAHGGRHPLPDPARFAAKLGEWGITPSTRVVVYDAANGANAAARVWWMLRALGHESVWVLDGDPSGLRAAPFAPAPPYPTQTWQAPIADIEEVDAARQDPTRRVLDARAGFRFRGESEPFDPVAGRIPGARNAFYGDNLDPAGRLRPPEALRAHYLALLGGVPPERTIVHCGSGISACHDLLALERAGLPGAALYVGSWSEWCRQPQRPTGRGLPE